jgi:hypothetical protein
LSEVRIEGVAEATGAHYVPMETDADIEPALDETQSVAADRPPGDRRREHRLPPLYADDDGGGKDEFESLLNEREDPVRHPRGKRHLFR